MSTNILYCDETDRVGGRHFSLELANFMLRKVETRFHTKGTVNHTSNFKRLAEQRHAENC